MNQKQTGLLPVIDARPADAEDGARPPSRSTEIQFKRRILFHARGSDMAAQFPLGERPVSMSRHEPCLGPQSAVSNRTPAVGIAGYCICGNAFRSTCRRALVWANVMPYQTEFSTVKFSLHRDAR